MTPVESGTRVRYHGSTGYCREKEFRVYNALPDAVKDEHTSEDGYRYGLDPVIPGTVSETCMDDYLWNVRRQSFTVIGDDDE